MTILIPSGLSPLADAVSEFAADRRRLDEQKWLNEAREMQRQRFQHYQTDRQQRLEDQAVARRIQQEKQARYDAIGEMRPEDVATYLNQPKSNPFYNPQMDPENPSLVPGTNITQEKIAYSPMERLQAQRRISKAMGNIPSLSFAELQREPEIGESNLESDALLAHFDTLYGYQQNDPGVSFDDYRNAMQQLQGANSTGVNVNALYKAYTSRQDAARKATTGKLSVDKMVHYGNILGGSGKPGYVTEWKTGPDAWVGKEVGGLPEAVGEDAFTTRPSTIQEKLSAARALKGSELTFSEKKQILSGPKQTEGGHSTVTAFNMDRGAGGPKFDKATKGRIVNTLFGKPSTDNPQLMTEDSALAQVIKKIVLDKGVYNQIGFDEYIGAKSNAPDVVSWDDQDALKTDGLSDGLTITPEYRRKLLDNLQIASRIIANNLIREGVPPRDVNPEWIFDKLINNIGRGPDELDIIDPHSYDIDINPKAKSIQPWLGGTTGHNEGFWWSKNPGDVAGVVAGIGQQGGLKLSSPQQMAADFTKQIEQMIIGNFEKEMAVEANTGGYHESANSPYANRPPRKEGQRTRHDDMLERIPLLGM